MNWLHNSSGVSFIFIIVHFIGAAQCEMSAVILYLIKRDSGAECGEANEGLHY